VRYSLLILALIVACGFTASGQTRSAPSPIRQIESAKWWIVPLTEGNTQEGKLYFGAVLENLSDRRLILIITFRAYKADGTPFDACSDGISVDIAPHEKALAVCSRSIVPRSVKDLQITSRITYLKPLIASPLNAVVMKSGLITKDSDSRSSIYEAFTLIKAQGNRDIQTGLLFRFYDENNIQIGTSESHTVVLEPEVAQKVSSLSLIVDAGSPQPKLVRIDVKGYAGN
jgi:hypothetical protein